MQLTSLCLILDDVSQLVGEVTIFVILNRADLRRVIVKIVIMIFKKEFGTAVKQSWKSNAERTALKNITNKKKETKNKNGNDLRSRDRPLLGQARYSPGTGKDFPKFWERLNIECHLVEVK